jgi:hypothetical protein
MASDSLLDDLGPVDNEIASLLETNTPVGLWPVATFLRFLQVSVSPSQWADWIGKLALPGVMQRFELTAFDLHQIASRQPVLISSGAESRETRKRRRELLAKVKRHPKFEDALAGLRTTWEDALAHGASMALAERLVYGDATRAACAIQIAGLKTWDLAWFLTRIVVDPASGSDVFQEAKRRFPRNAEEGDFEALDLPSHHPVVLANLNAQPVTIKILPGSILVDVTRSSPADLEGAVWAAIKQTQDRLEHSRPRRGGPKKDALYERVHEAVEKWRAINPRDYWSHVWDEISREVPEDERPQSITSLRRAYLAYIARTRSA